MRKQRKGPRTWRKVMWASRTGNDERWSLNNFGRPMLSIVKSDITFPCKAVRVLVTLTEIGGRRAAK